MRNQQERVYIGAWEWLVTIPAMALKVDDIGLVLEETYETRERWYDLGLTLRVSVSALDSRPQGRTSRDDVDMVETCGASGDVGRTDQGAREQSDGRRAPREEPEG